MPFVDEKKPTLESVPVKNPQHDPQQNANGNAPRAENALRGEQDKAAGEPGKQHVDIKKVFPNSGVTVKVEFEKAQQWAQENLPPTTSQQFLDHLVRALQPLVERSEALKPLVFSGMGQEHIREYDALNHKIQNVFLDVREGYEPDPAMREKSAALQAMGGQHASMNDPEVYRLLADERRYAASSLPPELSEKHFQQCLKRVEEIVAQRARLVAAGDALEAQGKIADAFQANGQRGAMLRELRAELAKMRDQNTPGFDEREAQRQHDKTPMPVPDGTTPADVKAAIAHEQKWFEIHMETQRQSQTHEMLYEVHGMQKHGGPAPDPALQQKLMGEWQNAEVRKYAANRAYVRAKMERLRLEGTLTPGQQALFELQMQQITEKHERSQQSQREWSAKREAEIAQKKGGQQDPKPAE